MLAQLSYSQGNFVYRGLIVDSMTDRGIAGVHIYSIENYNAGSVSNSDGTFILKSSQKLRALTFSHVSYKPYVYKIENNTDNVLQVVLKPSIQTLDEITVTSLPAREIVTRAIEKLKNNHFVEPVYYDFFTHVINYSKDSTLNFLEEHAGYIYQKENHNSEFSLSKSRLGTFSKDGEKLYHSHLLIAMSEMFTDNMGKYTEDYLHKRRYQNYEYKFGNDIIVMGRACYTIHFFTDRDTYYKKGTLYIDKENYGILKKTLNNSDYKEIINGISDFFAISSGFHIMGRAQIIPTLQIPIYNLTVKPTSVEFTTQGRLSPQFVKNVTSRFNEEFWDRYNFIPLPNWISEQIESAR
jgi:hypothetical protein